MEKGFARKAWRASLAAVLSCLALLFYGCGGDGGTSPGGTTETKQRFEVKSTTKISPDSQTRDLAASLREKIHENTGLDLSVTEGASVSGNVITLDIGGGLAGEGEDAYYISVGGDAVELRANTRRGAFYAIDTLMDNLVVEESGFFFPAMDLSERPALGVRAVHIPLTDNLEYMKETIAKAASLRFNTLIIMVNDMLKYQSHPELARKKSLTREELAEVVDYAKARFLDVIPQINLLTHQKYLLKDEYPALMLNDETYDPSEEEVYGIVFDLLEELLGIFEPSIVHIGHDEVWGVHWATKDLVKEEDAVLSYDEYAMHITRVVDWLQARGVRTMIWGDMFLRASDFPEMEEKNMHADYDYHLAVDMIPEDTIIVDWHYSDVKGFPTIDYFLDRGFDVLGSTWKTRKNIFVFSEYVASRGPGPLGMVATTWAHFNREEREVVDDILEWSGQAYWNGGE